MKKLNLRLFRMIKKTKGQYVAVLSIIITGIFIFTAVSNSAVNLRNTLDDYYDTTNFADIFVTGSALPERLERELEGLDNIRQADVRLSLDTKLITDDDNERVNVRAVSVDGKENKINELFVKKGRRRFWETELTEDKKAVYNTTYEVLVGLSQLIAPFAPYLSEELYRNLTGEESVHLSYYPKTNEDLIDENIEKRMDLVKDIVSLGRASRENAKIKVRQPIQKIHIDGKYQELIDDLVPLIKEELNVKEVVFEHDLNEFMDFTLKPNFKVAGPMLGSKVKEFTGILAKADALEIITKIQSGEKYELDVKGQILELDDQLLDIRISAKEGYDVATGYNLFTIIDTNLSDELLNEGYAREFISKVQQMRKNNGYEMMDRIKIFYTSSPEIDKAVKDFQDYIKEETLADAIIVSNEEGMEVQNLNGIDTGMKLEKVNR